MNDFIEKLEELKKLAIAEAGQLNQYIGIGITTHNRYDIFSETLKEIRRYAPENALIVVVDDASETKVPEADFRFNENVGIARAKNKCLELLYKAGCEHFFLFDDDCYPKTKDWYQPYVASKEPHLNYIFEEFSNDSAQKLADTILLYEDSQIKAYSHARGCMCYYKRICLDAVGGMSPIFGKWGYEHPDLSNRIYNAGLTRFHYMDVPGSRKLIRSRDEETGNEGSTVQGDERRECIARNSIIYDGRKKSAEYVPFSDEPARDNIILTCFFNNINDPQRPGLKLQADKELLNPLIKSLKYEKLVVLVDSFPDKVDDQVEYVKVETYIRNVYFQRWVSVYEYLLRHRDEIANVFIVDALDVEMQISPFAGMEYGKLYVGSEECNTGCEWMRIVNGNGVIRQFIERYKGAVLLNAGLLGGATDTVLAFLRKFLAFYFQMKIDAAFNNPELISEFDMGLFNYIARTEFDDCLEYGALVNTVFKANKRNEVSWFKHK